MHVKIFWTFNFQITTRDCKRNVCLLTTPYPDSSYGDSVMEVDYGVGVILAKLKELNIEQNTLVFFSSDNGAEGIAGKAG